MSLLDGFWKYAQSDWPAPILSIPAGTAKTAEFAQLVKTGLVREGNRQRFIQCPCCGDHCDEPLPSTHPDGRVHFMLSCPNCGGVEVLTDDMRVWCIHFSALPGMLAAHLGMREPQSIVLDTLWKMGHYGSSCDIWMARWLRNPEAKNWLSQLPQTPQTILLYLGPPPDFSQLADMPQGNVLDASEIISIDDVGLHVDMMPVDAALRQSASTALSSSAFIFKREGDGWRLVFEGTSVMARHVKGIIYIHHLLEIAPDSIPAVQLRRVADPDFQPELLGASGELLDKRALKEIHERLNVISDEIDQAKSDNDFGRQTELVDEQESLLEQLRVSSGLGGRKRKANDDLERNRKTVSKAIADAVKNITKVHPELGRHMETHISCGDHCSYRPEPGIVWST